MADTATAPSPRGTWPDGIACASCHAAGQSMTAVATWAGGVRTVEMHCDDVLACQQRAVPELAAALNGRALAPHAWTHPVTGLLTPLSRLEVDCLHARLQAAAMDARAALAAHQWGPPEAEALRALRDELTDTAGIAAAEMGPAQEREIGAEALARAIAANHRDAVARARELLAAEADQAGELS